MLLLLDGDDQLATSLVVRETLKCVALSAFGFAVGRISERAHRENFQLLRRFADDSQRQLASRRDLARLLLSTLPAPVVREIA